MAEAITSYTSRGTTSISSMTAREGSSPSSRGLRRQDHERAPRGREVQLVLKDLGPLERHVIPGIGSARMPSFERVTFNR